ncbi:MAG: Major Facilitator Superfamily [Mycobacterium sp.]|nr:Major Facilitator Superfamily [Mycobacterium sp.]
MDNATRRTVGFWVLATTLVAFLAASSAPTPLYLVYQSRWHFSAVMLTVAFATYAVALLLTLLTVGGLSDYLGRRRVLAGALLLELVSMGVFILADGLGWLLVARAVQGVATGMAAGALSAAIADLAPAGRASLASAVNTAAPSTGLAIGAITSGALVEYAPAPRTLIYVVLAVLFASMLIALAIVPETVQRRSGSLGSLRPRASVPPQAMGAFRIAVPVLVATWAVGGLVLSLGPTLAAGVFGLHNHLVGGLVVTAVAGTGALGSVVTRSAPARPTMVRGSLVLVVGVALFLVALATESTPTFFAGLVLCGWGFGTAFIGAFGSVAALANAQQRAEVFAALYVTSYLAFGGSAVLAGLAVPHFGLRPTSTVYGAIVIALSLAAAAAGRASRVRKVELADPALAAAEEQCPEDSRSVATPPLPEPAGRA